MKAFYAFLFCWNADCHLSANQIYKEMNKYEAADEIATLIPAAQDEIFKAVAIKHPYLLIGVFTVHIQRLIEAHNQAMVERCFRIMEKIHYKGDNLLKVAVENIFVFSLDRIVASCNASEKKLLMSKIPIGLYTAYVNQIYKSGI